jgi:hypothetical protein
MGLRSVFCCTADKCNAPDSRRDPATQLLPESWLSRSRPMSPRMAPLSGTAAAAAPYGTAAAGVSDNVTSAGGLAPVPAPISAMAPAMPFAAVEGVTGGSTSSSDGSVTASQQACWNSIPTAPGQAPEVALLTAEPGAQLCARWQLRCTMPSTACSQADVSARAWRWVYGSVDKAGCTAVLKFSDAGPSSRSMRNAYCCDGSGCNKPDSKLDAVTRVRKDSATGSSEAATVPGRAVAQPAVLQPGMGSSVGMQQPVLIAAIGSGGHPSSSWISRPSSSSSSGGGGWLGSGGSSSSGAGSWRTSSGSSTRDGNVSGR